MPYCIYCLKELNSGAEFCAGCGRPTGRAATATATRATASTPTANRSASNAQDSYKGQPTENLSLFGYFVKCLKKYANFSGRARRREYWGFLLYWGVFSGFITTVSIILLDVATARMINWLLGLMIFIPFSAVQARRLHDIGKGG